MITCLLKAGQVGQDCVQAGFEHILGWGLLDFSGKPNLVFNFLHGKKGIFLCWSEIGCISILSTSSCPVTEYNWEDSGSIFFIPPQQVFAHIGKILPEPSQGSTVPAISVFLRDRGAPDLYPSLWHFSELTPVGPCGFCPGKAMTGPISPELSHQCWVQGKESLPQLAGNTLPEGCCCSLPRRPSLTMRSQMCRAWSKWRSLRC